MPFNAPGSGISGWAVVIGLVSSVAVGVAFPAVEAAPLAAMLPVTVTMNTLILRRDGALAQVFSLVGAGLVTWWTQPWWGVLAWLLLVAGLTAASEVAKERRGS